MNFTLSVPGKTFLCGEYLALHGGPCLLLATEPRFKLQVEEFMDASGDAKVMASRTQNLPFHPESPAGRYFAAHAEDLKPWRFTFNNPYGAGGFGGSTAEFILLKAFHELRRSLETEAQLDLDLKETLQAFRSLHEGFVNPPSGADLVGQACGQVTAFERRSGKIQTFGWPFTHLSWALFSTGLKVATHNHLRTLEMKSTEIFESSCYQVWESLRNASEGEFILGLHEFSRLLDEHQFQCQETMTKTKEIRNWPGVRVAKGCGALGADVIFVLIDRRETRLDEVIPRAEKLGLQFRGTESQLSPGLLKVVRNQNSGVSDRTVVNS